MSHALDPGSGGGHELVVHLVGDIDHASRCELHEIVLAFRRSGQTSARVNVQHVGFMDSMGIQGLLDLHRVAVERGGTVTVVGAGRPVRRVLSLTGADQLLLVEGSASAS